MLILKIVKWFWNSLIVILTLYWVRLTPYLRYGINMLKTVQHRATLLI